ncbi:glycosyltransferase family 4 protein [Pseudomonas sp. TNT2022 ID357]|uniref:Glycosyltransferase family 4 protein n=1 Tax=Pseudomonas idahonensis TaxID=2942628 RepID=A0ABT5Q3V3_9PSED|nr:glycosyltransferase family 1 protein [Pseudomonas idahonensis]MDD1148878.1 glycosyltransferase family 4 protein [Pseudomonas idahonensis]
MKVLMGTDSLRPPLTGIGNYTLNLLREFQALADIEAVDCFDGNIFSSSTDVLSGQGRHLGPSSYDNSDDRWRNQIRKTVRAMPLAYSLKSVWSNLRFKQGSPGRQDFVYHEPNFILKPHDGPSVATVHDLSFVQHPEFHPAERVAWLSRQLPRTLDRADFIITDSEVVRAELIEQFSVPRERVKAIYLGADARFKQRSADATKTVLARYGLVHGSYLAFVGTIEPRKGISVLLDAWERLMPSIRRAWPLVIAGASGWHNAQLMGRIEALRAKGEVKYLQFVSAQDLPFIYSGAATFIYPSVYEGFGLPVLEAMASGVPAICGAGTSMAEFAEGACKLFEVTDADALAQSIFELVEDASLRARIAHFGMIQANKFSWARCARETFKVYMGALGES